MLIAYELTMPQRNSWNGRWSGEDKRYIKIRSYHRNMPEEKSYYYSFGDGWSANIEAYKVDAKEAAKLRRKLDKEYTATEVLSLIQGQYGEEKFRELVEKGAQ
jgi:hypothetical protein